MASSESEIKQNLLGYIWGYGGIYSSWYVGISENPKDRLFSEHGVKEKEDAWICQKASSSEAARRVENYFIDILGTDGDSVDAGADALFIYAYKKKPYTNP
ncbi:hypothetical protein KGY73_09620 [bacterium]|nr:hypothetical protein [bacterium]